MSWEFDSPSGNGFIIKVLCFETLTSSKNNESVKKWLIIVKHIFSVFSPFLVCSFFFFLHGIKIIVNHGSLFVIDQITTCKLNKFVGLS